MNAFELYNSECKPIGVWCCGVCRSLKMRTSYNGQGAPTDRETAEACCQPVFCGRCGKSLELKGMSDRVFAYTDCGVSRLACADCERKMWDQLQGQQQRERLKAAETVTYAGDTYLFLDGTYNGSYHPDMESVLDRIDGLFPPDRPQFAYLCTKEIRTLDIHQAIDRELESVCEDGYEDMGIDIVPTQYLIDAVKKFNEEHKNEFTVYNPDYSKKVEIPCDYVTCDACKGSAVDARNDDLDCEKCDGNGHLPKSSPVTPVDLGQDRPVVFGRDLPESDVPHAE